MINLEPIAKVKSTFTDKFGIPRQPGLCPSAQASLEFPNNDFYKEALKDLEDYSHIWIIFYFHSLKKSPDKAKIRPPRLGGNKYVGVFSSRSPYRPNRIGLSLVKNEGVKIEGNKIELNISDHDLLDGTPVLDIKPYISHDVPAGEVSLGWQSEPWDNLEVDFTDEALESVSKDQNLRCLIIEMLRNNPSPAYIKNKDCNRVFKMRISDLEIAFKIDRNLCTVLKITA